MTYKTHLPATDQSRAWVGHLPHHPKRTVRTRCGQVHDRDWLVTEQRLHLNPRVVEDPSEATCKSCLHSYGVEHLGLSRDQILRLGCLTGYQLNVIDAITVRKANGPPLSEQDITAYYWSARLVGLSRRKAALYLQELHN